MHNLIFVKGLYVFYMYDIVIVVYVCIDMSFWRWSLRPKHVKNERLKEHNIYQSHLSALIIFYTISSVTDQNESSQRYCNVFGYIHATNNFTSSGM
jgi:hypothetical protein